MILEKETLTDLSTNHLEKAKEHILDPEFRFFFLRYRVHEYFLFMLDR